MPRSLLPFAAGLLHGALAEPSAAASLDVVSVDEAARVTCALHWEGGVNLSPFLSPTLLRAKQGTTIDAAALLGEPVLTAFREELVRLRGARASASDVGEELPYGVRQCYGGSSTVSFAPSFDFKYNMSTWHEDSHLLVERGIKSELEKQHAERRKGERHVLSLGCGDGRWVASYAKEALAAGDRLMLMDLHEDNLALAKERVIAASPGTPVKTMAVDLNNLNGKMLAQMGGHRKYAVVESSLALHHVEDLGALLRDIKRCLTRDGVFVWLDVLDVNVPETGGSVPLRQNHTYVPPFHGVEFFRSKPEIVAALAAARLKLVDYKRVDPATLYAVVSHADRGGGMGKGMGKRMGKHLDREAHERKRAAWEGGMGKHMGERMGKHKGKHMARERGGPGHDERGERKRARQQRREDRRERRAPDKARRKKHKEL